MTNIANHARVRLFFNNPSDFQIYVLGANMKVVIDDLDMLWSSVIFGAGCPVFPDGTRTGSENVLAPQPCRPRQLKGCAMSHEAFLKCCYENRANPVEVIKPNTETEVSAYIYLKNTLPVYKCWMKC